MRHVVVPALLGLLVLQAGPAQAAIEPRTFEVELYGGLYAPKPNGLKTGPSFGARIGYNLNAAFNLRAELGYLDSSVELTNEGNPPLSGETSFNVAFIDYSVVYYLRPADRWATNLFAGPGWAIVSIDESSAFGQQLVMRRLSLQEDGFTMHVGAGGKLDVGRRFYLSSAARLRWFADRSGGNPDAEITLGAGVKLGAY